MQKLPNTGIFIVGCKNDKNGNKVVLLKNPKYKGFSIQTNGKLHETNRLIHVGQKFFDFSKTELEVISLEVIGYIEKYMPTKVAILEQPTFHVLPNGNLKIVLDSKIREEILELREDDNKSDDDIFFQVFEPQFCNGWATVLPERIGAWIDSILISSEYISDETTQSELDEITVWYNNNYMLRTEIEDLLKDGFVIFTKS